MKNDSQCEKDLYFEFGNGNILILTTESKKIIFSKQNGQGEIGEMGPFGTGDEYSPTLDDAVLKFNNLESLLVLKKAVCDIEEAFLKEPTQ